MTISKIQIHLAYVLKILRCREPLAVVLGLVGSDYTLLTLEDNKNCCALLFEKNRTFFVVIRT